MPDEMFVNFPSEYQRKDLARIIENIQFLPKERRERDNSYLKMDYDEKTKSIVATYDFYIIYNFPSLWELMKDSEKFNEEIKNIQIDIIHELSHLLGIGTSADTNFTSQLFSQIFLQHTKGIKYACSNADFDMSFYPFQRNFFLSLKKSNENASPNVVNQLNSYPNIDSAEEIFEDDYIIEDLTNFRAFKEMLELNHYWLYVTDPKTEGTVYIWSYVKDMYKSLNNKKLGKRESYDFGAMFLTMDQEGSIFQSEINSTGNESFNSSDKAYLGNYTEKLFTSLKFSSDRKKASWTYDMKIEPEENFIVEATEEDIQQTKEDRGQLHKAEEFTCNMEFSPIPFKAFIEFPVSGFRDPNMSKLSHKIDMEQQNIIKK